MTWYLSRNLPRISYRILYSGEWCGSPHDLHIHRGEWTRGVSTVQKHDPSDIRNIGLVAHIDSGKTTLTESILHTSQYLSTPGSVDTGSTTTDFLPAERARGITIQSASIPVRWRNWTYNLVDTPGHADFGMEVEGASRVMDGAVVLIDSVEGVEAQTKGVWRQLDRYNVPTRLLFINKLDRAGSSLRSSLLSLLSHRLHPKPTLLTVPVASFEPKDYKTAEPGVHGIVDLVKWEVWKWELNSSDNGGSIGEDGGEVQRYPLPRTIEEYEVNTIIPSSHPLHSHLVPARSTLLENLSMFSEELMDILLSSTSTPTSYLTLTEDILIPVLRSLTLRNDILPVLCGSAMRHVGTELVLDYVGHLLASPVDVASTRAPAKQDVVQMLAWKVIAICSSLRTVVIHSDGLFPQGTLTKQSTLINTTRNQKERVSKLLLLYASQPEEVDVLPFGSVGVILGLKHTRTGDTLVSTAAAHGGGSKATVNTTSVLRDITPPPAVMSASIIAQSASDLQPVQDALTALARTDPSVRVETSDGQLLMHGLGALHLEIVEGRLRDEWGVQFQTGARRVSYRESFAGGDGQIVHVRSSWKSDYHGKPIVVDVVLELRALRQDEEGDAGWDGNVVLTDDGEVLPPPDAFRDHHSPLAHISQGLSITLSNSPLSSLPLSRLHITVKSFQYPPEANAAVLAGATSVILREALVKAGMGPVMEPYIHLKVEITEDYFGKVVKDLTENGGELVNLTSPGGAADEQQDVVPFSQDCVYVPPAWVSPSSLPTASFTAAQSLKRIIHAVAPLSKMLDFSNRLRAMSGGHGTFEMFNAGFRPVPPPRQLEILREIGRA